MFISSPSKSALYGAATTSEMRKVLRHEPDSMGLRAVQMRRDGCRLNTTTSSFGDVVRRRRLEATVSSFCL